MPWENKVEPKHACPLPGPVKVADDNAQTGSVWRCHVCDHLWILKRGNFRNSWTRAGKDA